MIIPKQIVYRRYVAIRDNEEDKTYYVVDTHENMRVARTFKGNANQTKSEVYREALTAAERFNREYFQTKRRGVA